MKRAYKYLIILSSIVILAALILIYAGVYSLVFSRKNMELLEGSAIIVVGLYTFIRVILILADLLFGSKPMKFHFSLGTLLFTLFIYNFFYLLAGPYSLYAIKKPLEENFYIHFTLLLIINHFACLYLVKTLERLKLKHLTKYSS